MCSYAVMFFIFLACQPLKGSVYENLRVLMTCTLAFGLKITVTGVIIFVLCTQRNKPDGKTMDRDAGQKGLKRKFSKREKVEEGLNKCIYAGLPLKMSFPCGTLLKNPPANAGVEGSIPNFRRYLVVGNNYPLQYSCLENLMGRGAWQATVQATAWQVAKELDMILGLNNSNHQR